MHKKKLKWWSQMTLFLTYTVCEYDTIQKLTKILFETNVCMTIWNNLQTTKYLQSIVYSNNKLKKNKLCKYFNTNEQFELNLVY